MIEPGAGDELNVSVHLHLVLKITRTHSCRHTVISVRGALSECYRCNCPWVAVRHLDRGRCVIEKAGVSKVECSLVSDFKSTQHSVFYRAGCQVINKICLAKKVSSFRRIILRRQRDECFRAIDRTWHVVLIKAVVITIECPISENKVSELSIDRKRR